MYPKNSIVIGLNEAGDAEGAENFYNSVNGQADIAEATLVNAKEDPAKALEQRLEGMYFPDEAGVTLVIINGVKNKIDIAYLQGLIGSKIDKQAEIIFA